MYTIKNYSKISKFRYVLKNFIEIDRNGKNNPKILQAQT